jgi:hypothetical protein
VPIPPQLLTLLREHIDTRGTAPDGRLFRAARGGILHESCYGRTWHTARAAALGPALAATPLARRPYGLRHAALSLWLACGAPPAEIAARAGHSTHVLLSAYAHRIPGHDRIASQAIEHALSPDCTPSRALPGNRNTLPPKTALAMAIEDHPHAADRAQLARQGISRPSHQQSQRTTARC